MAWTVRVVKDPDKEAVGTATATWDASGPNKFIFSARGERKPEDYALFIASARAARDKFLADRAVEVEVAAELAELLNAEEG